jgi:hypothetical protein
MKKTTIGLFAFLVVIATFISCSKSGNNNTDPCNGVTITVTTNVTNTTSGQNNGSITVTASGSSGFTYSINNGAFQSGNTFGSLAAGNYSLTVKDANGCTKSTSAAVGSGTATNGPLFTAVKTIVQTNCAVSGCHDAASSGGVNFTTDASIVANGARIKLRAVDQAGMASQMPQPPLPALSTANQQAITNWLNAGGRLDN